MITLNNEDCLETIKKLEDNTIDLCLTDLPYGILKSKKKEANYNNENRNFCDWDFEIDYDEVLPHLKRVMKKDGNVLLFARSPFTFRLYEQMTKHGFTFRYNWIWKKNSCPNFAVMKYRPGCNYEEVMVFSPTPNKGKYFAHADFNGEVKIICNFYDYEKRTPLNSEEVFDNYLIPFIFGNDINKDVRIACSGDSVKGNTGNCLKLNNIFNENNMICIQTHGGKTSSDHMSVPRINLKEIINDEKKNPFNISSYFGISSTYVTYSIDKSLEQKYYARDYILQLKCKNEIKKTIELYIENSYTDADYYNILLPSNTLPWSGDIIFMRIISPTEWRIQETSSSGFTNISPSSGVGSQNIVLSYSNNDNITPRETTLELYSLPDEILRKSLNIIQTAKPA